MDDLDYLRRHLDDGIVIVNTLPPPDDPPVDTLSDDLNYLRRYLCDT